VNEHPTPEPTPDIDRLRAAHPLWTITATWATAATGPEYRRLAAVREGTGVRVVAWTPAELEALIEARESAHGWG
jgi:hypothetical protein